MRKKLTSKYLDSLPPAQGKRYEVRDELIVGLHVRVSQSGAKVWYLGTRVDGRVRRLKLGTFPILSLADAREKAREILRAIQLGSFEERDQEPKARVPTLAEVIPTFIELYAKPRNRDWKGTQSILKKFAPIEHKPIHTIRRTDVVRVLDNIVACGTPYRANRALAAIKKLMSWCVDRGTLEISPLVALRPPTKEVSRDRVLSNAELAACWKAAEAEGFPFAQCVQLLILTGQRRGEVSGMRWSEINMEEATWTIPAQRAKNATQHTVPLPPLAIAILRSVPRFLASDYVFTTTGRTPISGFGRLKKRVESAATLQAWRLHDIRRTVATKMAVSGVAPHVIEAVLNHKTGVVSGVAAIYNRHAYFEEKRVALTNWAAALTTLVGTVTADGLQADLFVVGDFAGSTEAHRHLPN